MLMVFLSNVRDEGSVQVQQNPSLWRLLLNAYMEQQLLTIESADTGKLLYNKVENQTGFPSKITRLLPLFIKHCHVVS